MTTDAWEPQQGQCLTCGGRGGWWSWEFRETCSRCEGTGWDPARDKPGFPKVEPTEGVL